MTLPKYRDLVIPVGVLEDNSEPITVSWLPEQGGSEEENTFSEPVEVTFQTDRVDSGFLVKLSAQGRAALICDRCGTDFVCPVAGEVKTFYTYSEGMDKGDEIEIHVLPSSAKHVDLKQDTLDALFLGLPPKHLCSENCKGLCDQCGANFNEGSCDCNQEKIDPRWEALKGLKLDGESE